jgi:heme/copper-type cytochrome/quinol oxidase subunit 2
MAAPANPKLRHFTTRRGFVIFVGLLVLTLYFMWAGYGAAPTSLSFLDETESESMGGHGSGTGAMTPEEFHEITTKFAEDLSLPDGSVRPTRQWMVSMAAMGGGREDRDDEAGEHRDKDEAPGHGSSMMGTDDDGKTEREHDQTDAIKPSGAAGMASSTEMPAVVTRQHKEAKGADEEGEPIDVYLMAMQFSYIPRVLRLEKGVPYRFLMMSMDVNHGASIHTGFAGHIMRRPAQTMTEMVMTFPNPGEYMMYCRVYCGEGHSRMKGKIIVK